MYIYIYVQMSSGLQLRVSRAVLGLHSKAMKLNLHGRPLKLESPEASTLRGLDDAST